MSFARSLKRRLRASVPSLLFLALAGYFAWNATRGDLGLRAYAGRKLDLASARASLAAAEAERASWQAKVAAVQPAHLDTDALDQLARQTLGLANANDLIIPAKN